LTIWNEKLLLVGDNPFHNISHLSQGRARTRTEDPSDPKYAAHLIKVALDNGANGFTFSVSETTLSILSELKERYALNQLHLLPVVPYAFEYVRLASQLGGISSLVRKLGMDILKSRNLKAIRLGVKGALTRNPEAIMKTYLAYEISRVEPFVDNKVCLDSLLLHQLITDMALALNLDLFFKTYIDFLSSYKITPGFNTGNFAFLVNKFNEWNIDLREVVVAAPFNKIGFQMVPSIQECEKFLRKNPAPFVIALSVLAAGYIQPKDAAEYIATLPQIKGIALGVSKEKHAKETFSIFTKVLET
jgi:hypothetical protein